MNRAHGRHFEGDKETTVLYFVLRTVPRAVPSQVELGPPAHLALSPVIRTGTKVS
jgi:hypothetical protein